MHRTLYRAALMIAAIALLLGAGVTVNAQATDGVTPATTIIDPIINEFSFNDPSTDDFEFIEISGDPSVSYSGFTLLVIEGDSTGSGTIDDVITVGTTNAQGYWSTSFTGFLSNEFENGTNTILLVDGFTGSSGTDLDTNDDGTFDVTLPWSRIVDDVAVDDGGSSDRKYSQTVLAGGFDGNSFDVGAASRIPDSTDTDSISDWVRNDFEGEGFNGVIGSPERGEALNTPGAANQVVVVEPIINEWVFNHTGTDTNEYVEILASPATDYSGYTLVVIEGDSNSSSLGDITAVEAVGTTNATGYFLIGIFDSVFQNGTQTALLVEGFSGSNGDAVDTNDDGTPDVEPWVSIVDSFAVNDGGSGDLVYSTLVFDSSFDNVSSFTPGGASRIPNGTDTDSLSDWLRNDFDLAGIQTGTPEEGEAENTPGAINSEVDVAPPQNVFIRDIQGAALVSPLNGQSVTDVPGIVTGLKSNGFFFQDPNPDNDIATSEGIFVFTSSTPTVAVGDSVTVSGTVSEFFEASQISSTGVNIVSSGNTLPAAIVIGSAGRQIPSDTVFDDDNASTFDAATDVLDFFESLEGMRVSVDGGTVVAPTNRFEEFTLVNQDTLASGTVGLLSPRSTIVIRETDFNPERIVFDGDLTGIDSPIVLPGETVTSTLTGVMDFTFGQFKIQIDEDTITFFDTGGDSFEPESTTLMSTADRLSIAAYNVENLDPSDTADFPLIAAQIVNDLNSPDIIGLQEVQDNSGSTDDGVVSASQTYTDLITAISNAGGPTYEFREIAPQDKTDGGQPGGNIRVGFLFQPARVTFVDRGSAGPTDSTAAQNGSNGVELSLSPGRIDPTNSAFDDSRKPLVGEFQFNGNTVFVINVHMNSKSGDDGLYSTTQPPVLDSETQRLAQATVINGFVDSLLALDASAKVALIGDTNDFQFSAPITTLKGDDMVNLVDLLPENDRYTFIFNGNAQVLDNFLVSDGLDSARVGFDIVHGNAERDADSRPSDHDPAIGLFNLPATQAPTAEIIINPTARQTVAEGSSVQFTVTLAGAPSAPVTLPLGTSSNQCTLSTPSVVLNDTNFQTGVTFTVDATEETVVDGTQPCNLFTNNPTSGDPAYNAITAADVPNVFIDVTDNDTAGIPAAINITPRSRQTVAEGSSVQFTVTLASSPSAPVTLPLGTSSN
ncbi:MAG: hypothetical protein AAFU54_27670, partial [Chloroflexota bacterium]